MPCFHPNPAVVAYYRGNRRMKLIGRNTIEQLRPDQEVLWLDCQTCVGCRDKQSATWALRLKHESRSHASTLFLTLTHDEDHETNSLNKKDLQDFWKRLRKTTQQRLKYFACGEYGDKTHRPHYHGVVFGLEHFSDEKRWDMEQNTSETLNKIWGQGRVTIAPITDYRMRYVTGYVLKKAGYKKQIYCDEDGVEVEPPFQVMSTGLGKNWVRKYANDIREGWILADVENDAKVGIPRYYQDILKRENETLAAEIQTNKDKRRAALPAPDPARNRAAEKIYEQRIKEHRSKKQL